MGHPRTSCRAHGFGLADVIRVRAGFKSTSLVAEAGQVEQAHFLQGKLQRRADHAKTIRHAAPKVDRRRFLKIFRGAGNLADTKSEVHALRQHLIIEDKVIGIFEQGQISQHFAAESTVARVVFGKLHAQKNVLERGEQAIGNIFVDWHAAEQGAASYDARSENDIVYVICHHTGHRGDEQRCVLIVRVQHDDDVCARVQRLAIAGHLIAAVTVVTVVLEDEQAEFARDIDGLVAAVVVDEDADIDEFRQFTYRDLQGLLRIVGGHDDRDALAVDHWESDFIVYRSGLKLLFKYFDNFAARLKEAAEKVPYKARIGPHARKRRFIFNIARHEWNSCPSRS
jgi:hypothetical protein